MSKNDEATCSVKDLKTVESDEQKRIKINMPHQHSDVAKIEDDVDKSGGTKFSGGSDLLIKNDVIKTEMMPKLTSIQLPASIKVTKVVQTKTPENKVVYVKILTSTASSVMGTTTTSSHLPLTVAINESHLPTMTGTTNITSLKSPTTSESESSSDVKPVLNENTVDTTFDEAEHNATPDDVTASSTPKISREMRELKKMMNESKILSEFINDPQHQRKSRKSNKMHVDHDDDDSLSTVHRRRSRSSSKSHKSLSKVHVMDHDDDSSSMQQHQQQDNQRRSRSRSKSVMSQYSDANTFTQEDMMDGNNSLSRSSRRSMRSQNLEFAQKQQKFLSRIQHSQDSDGTYNSDEETQEMSPSKSMDGSKSSGGGGSGLGGRIRMRKNLDEISPPPKEGWDKFCWRCHQDGSPMIPCVACKRSYHLKCAKITHVKDNWTCHECVTIDLAENSPESIIAKIGLEELNSLLMFALKRMKIIKGSYDLLNLNQMNYQHYDEFIVNPVDLHQLQMNIHNRKYKSTDSFLADAQWLLHNLFVFFPDSSKLTSLGKMVVKVCKQEMYEIETCHECYYNANTRKEWFTEVCSKPHLLLWAKLKSFPYWPAKAMVVNPQQLVSVRFFGDHDRAWVPVKDCFLYSDRDPNVNLKTKRNNIAESVNEVDIHIEKIKAKFGDFKHAELRTPYDPKRDDEQLQMMIPSYSKFTFDAKNTKSKLTYKIVKTADNNMSISPVLNGGGSTTPLSSPLKREEETITVTSGVGKKLGKSALGRRLNNEDCDDSTTTPKTYQVVRRKSTIDGTTPFKRSLPTKEENSDEEKLEKMIIKRKSDNWNTITIPLKRRRSHNENGVAATKTKTKRDDLMENKSGDGGDSPENNVEDPMDKIKVFTIKQSTSSTPKGKQKKSPTEEKNHIGDRLPKTAATTMTTSTNQIAEIAGVEKKIIEDKVAIVEPNTNNPLEIKDDEDLTKKDNIGDKKLNENDKKVEKSSSNSNLSSALSNVVENINIQTSTISKNLEKSPKIPEDDKKLELANISPAKIDKNTSSIKLRSQKRLATDKSIEVILPEKILDTTRSASTSAITIKVEPLSDDDDPMTNDAGNNCQSVPIVNTASTIIGTNSSSSGFVTVRDINMMTNPTTVLPTKVTTRKSSLIVRGNSNFTEPLLPMSRSKSVKTQRARKTFPSRSPKQFSSVTSVSSNINATTSTTSTTTSFNQTNMSRITTATNSRPPALNVCQNIKNPNSMVYIPIDPKHTRTNDPMNDFIRSSSMCVPPLVTVGGQMVLTTLVSQDQATKVSDSISASSTSSSSLSTLATTTSGGSEMMTTTNGPKIPPLAPTSNNPQSSMSPNNNVMASYLTPSLAAAITETLVRMPPKLTSKPSGPLRGDGHTNISLADAGPLSRKLTDNAYKMTDYFRAIIEETIGDLSASGSLESKVRHLELELEKLKSAHAQEISELKHNTDVILMEMRNNLENEKNRLLNETRKQCEQERLRAVEETKRKQWCVNCGKEAQFYCCWNTSYCDYPCQQHHWPRHMASCAQTEGNNTPMKGNKPNVSGKGSGNKQDLPRILNTTTGGVRNSVPRNAIPLQRLVPVSNTQTGAPCYTIVHSRRWEMMSPNTNKVIGGGVGGGSNLQQQNSHQATGNIIVTTGGNTSTVLPPGAQIMEPIIIPEFVINQQNIVVPKSN